LGGFEVDKEGAAVLVEVTNVHEAGAKNVGEVGDMVRE